MKRLENVTAIVTGGASIHGIGRATARLLLSQGADVVIADIQDDEGKELAAELGPKAMYMHVDVSSETDWNGLVAAAGERFGKVNALVSCAGIALDGTIESTSTADYERVVGISQTGVWLGIRSVAPALRAAGGGSIVNVSSVAGTVGQPGLGSYSAAKWAIRGITRQAALELAASGIRVNAVLPGFVDTMMGGQGAGQRESIRRNKGHSGSTVPLGRIGEPEEVAQVIAFLVSGESSYCTGSDFLVDGGMLAGPLAEAADWA
ncbi:SDR family NAD(P)-dependent oxidoreductase [Streptomyces sp. BH104]|uniref:SDR family NAD(P)-dependent oxidoreductase n=1 Tax=Streptomyces sp. BH104 TaxID=3410407 RepID=UPI003BB7BC71